MEIAHNTEDPQGLDNKIREIELRLRPDRGFEPWQRASIKRVIADFYLSKGRLREARAHLLEAISDLNKRDPKIWLSYARLNETVLEARGDAQSRLNALKGLLCATTLSLHKSRLIIPRMLRLLQCSRARESGSGADQVRDYWRANAEFMPTWIWIFWTPQLFMML